MYVIIMYRKVKVNLYLMNNEPSVRGIYELHSHRWSPEGPEDDSLLTALVWRKRNKEELTARFSVPFPFTCK